MSNYFKNLTTQYSVLINKSTASLGSSVLKSKANDLLITAASHSLKLLGVDRTGFQNYKSQASDLVEKAIVEGTVLCAGQIVDQTYAIAKDCFKDGISGIISDAIGMIDPRAGKVSSIAMNSKLFTALTGGVLDQADDYIASFLANQQVHKDLVEEAVRHQATITAHKYLASAFALVEEGIDAALGVPLESLLEDDAPEMSFNHLVTETPAQSEPTDTEFVESSDTDLISITEQLDEIGVVGETAISAVTID